MINDITHIDYRHKTPWFIWPLVVAVLAAFIQPIVMGMGG